MIEPNEKYFTNFSYHPCIYVSESLIATLRMKVGAKVMLTLIDDPNDNNVACNAINIFPNDIPISEEMFRSYVSCNIKTEKFLLNSHSKLIFDDGTYCFIKMSPENCKYAIFDENLLSRMKINVNDTPAMEDMRVADELSSDMEIAINNTSIE